MLLFLLISYETLLYQKSTYEYAVYEAYFDYHLSGKMPALLPLDKWEEVKNQDVKIFLTGDKISHIREIAKLLPVRFKGDTVIFPDTSFNASDYIFLGKFPNPFNPKKSISLEIGRNAEAFGGAGNVEDSSFTLSRKRDGIFYREDVSASGKWHFVDGKLKISKIKWYRHPERNLRKMVFNHIKLYYGDTLFTKNDASKFARLLEEMYKVYDKIGPMPDTVYVYIYLVNVPKTKYSTYANGFDTFWSKISDKNEFLKGRKNWIVSYAHEMARISFQPFSNAYPPAMGADDWSHFAPMVLVIPHIDSVFGDTAWFYPFNYQKKGIPLFKSLIKGCQYTYESILYDVYKKYGLKVISEALKSTIPNKYFRSGDMKDFMEKIAEFIPDRKLKKRIKNGFPTPFEHSLLRWKGWQPLGITPVLVKMLWNNDFTVKGLEKGSIADSLGINIGDRLITINGYSVDKNKALAYRSLLLMKDKDTAILLFKRNEKVIKIKFSPISIWR